MKHVERDGENLRFRRTGFAPLDVRILYKLICGFGKQPRLGQVVGLFGRLKQEGRGNLAGVLVSAKDGEWYLQLEPPRKTG